MDRVRIAQVQQKVESEVAEADRHYGGFRSTHEGLGVLMEEVAELVERIRGNELASIRDEAVQVSAVALRLAVMCHAACEPILDSETNDFFMRSTGGDA